MRTGVGRPRWMSPSTPSTACWSSDARATSAPPDPGRGWGQCARTPDPCTTLAPAALAAAGLGLAGGAPAALARPRAADVGLVGLDAPGQGLAVGADHGLAELVQPGPGGLVAAQAQLPLELGGGDPALAGRH